MLSLAQLSPRLFLHGTGIFLHVTGNFFLWQEISYCDRKFLSVTGSFFQWQENSSCDRKFPHVLRNFSLREEISYSHRKFLLETGCFFHKISFQEANSCNISPLWYKIETKGCDFLLYLKTATKVRDFCSKLGPRVQGFLARFLPPCQLKSHPAMNPAGPLK